MKECGIYLYLINFSFLNHLNQSTNFVVSFLIPKILLLISIHIKKNLLSFPYSHKYGNVIYED